MQSKEQIFSHIQESLPLPSLPHILIKLIDVCDDEDASISAVAPLVAQDVSLSSRVLRLVNSAYFGLNRTFSNLNQAVVYLGASTIKNLAITASVQQVFKGLGSGTPSFEIGYFWYHSLLCATLGKRIAKVAGYTNIEEAYLAGLLHNIGQLVLLGNYPKEIAFIQEQKENGADECAEEERQIGITHCDVGFRLLKKWNIGSFIADAAFYHHATVEQIREAFSLVKITFFADRLSESSDSELADSYLLGRDLLDLGQPQVQQIMADAKEEVIEIARDLEVDIKIPKVGPSKRRKNGKHHQYSKIGREKGESSELFLVKNQELLQQVKNDSFLTGFLKDLIRKEGRDSILAACEEIIRILFGQETIFFLLYNTETKKLKGETSSGNRHRELVQDLVLSAVNDSSLAFRSLIENRVLTLYEGAEQLTNLADVQLFNAVNGNGMMYLPMIVRQERVGVIVLSGLAENDKNKSRHHKQLRLIADQTAISLHLDETNKKEAEKLHSERMATASLAAKKIVHEVNNPLGIISNYLKLLEMKVPAKTDIQQELQILGEEISRISTIIGQLSNFAENTCYQIEKINVNNEIGAMLRILTVSLLAPADIQVDFLPDSQLKEIITEKDKLKQIIINLVKNAAEAMTTGGSIRITTINRIEKEVVVGIVITLSDNGPGIPVQIREKLFSPFMTTKKHGHSGLGLSIVHNAVHDIGGTIKCESSREKGTCFIISLPLNIPDVENEKRG